MDDQRTTNQEDKGGEFVAGALIGALAGGVAALLLAPKNGQEMRQMMREYVKEWEQDAHHFAEDAQEMAATFKQALEAETGEFGQKHPDVMARTAQVQQVAQSVGQGYEVAREAMGEVVEAVKSGWDEYAQSQPVSRADHSKSTNDRAKPDDATDFRPEDVPEAAPQTAPEIEEPAFVRAARRQELESQAESAPVIEQEQVEDQAWSPPAARRRTASAGEFALHASSSWDGQADDIEEVEPTLLQSVHEVQQEVGAPTEDPFAAIDQEVESKQSFIAKRDASGRKPLYTHRVLEEPRVSTEPVVVQPIVADKPVVRAANNKKLFFRKK